MTKKSKGTHWFSLFINRNTDVYSDSFGVVYISLEVLKKSKLNHNIFRIQDNDSIMMGFYCIAFTEFMLVRLYFFFSE